MEIKEHFSGQILISITWKFGLPEHRGPAVYNPGFLGYYKQNQRDNEGSNIFLGDESWY